MSNNWKPGDRAVFVPRHAIDDAEHRDARPGEVKAINGPYVTFRYDDNGHSHSVHHSRLQPEPADPLARIAHQCATSRYEGSDE